MTTPDLGAVDELCRLALVARRLGCRVHLVGAGPELRGLLEVAGVGDVLGECPARGWTLRSPVPVPVPVAAAAAARVAVP